MLRTRVPHGRVQQVHGGSAQAQPVHPVRGLFEIRHHAGGAGPETGAGTGRAGDRGRGAGPGRDERRGSPGAQVGSCGREEARGVSRTGSRQLVIYGVLSADRQLFQSAGPLNPPRALTCPRCFL